MLPKAACKNSEQQPDQIERMKDAVSRIFGWQIVLVVNQAQVHASGMAFDPWQGGIEMRIPLESEAGIEVLVASLGDRPAEFTLKR